MTLTIEELEKAWGSELFVECWNEARDIRKSAWEKYRELNPNVQEIDFEPSLELILVVGIRKLFKVSLYNRGDFPAKP